MPKTATRGAALTRRPTVHLTKDRTTSPPSDFFSGLLGDSLDLRVVVHLRHLMMGACMVLPLSMDLRLRIATALDEGETVRGAAKRFGVSVASAVRIGQRQGSGRGQGLGKIGGHRRPKLVGEAGDWLLARLAEKPDLTMRALTTELAGRSVHAAHDTVWRFVKRAGQSVKKNADGQRADAPEGGAVPGALAGASTSA